jgi:hypothetical protein
MSTLKHIIKSFVDQFTCSSVLEFVQFLLKLRQRSGIYDELTITKTTIV